MLATIHLEPKQVSRISTATGLPPESIKAMLLGSFGEMPAWYGPAPTQISAPAWARVRFLNPVPRFACAACREENGGISLLKWHHQLQFACISHGVYHTDFSTHECKSRHPYAQRRSRQAKPGVSHPRDTTSDEVLDPRVIEVQSRLQGLIDPGTERAASSLKDETGLSPRVAALELRAAIRAVCVFSTPQELPATEPRLEARLECLASKPSVTRANSLRRADLTLEPELVAAVLLIAAPMVLANPEEREAARVAFVRSVRSREHASFYYRLSQSKSDRSFVENLMGISRRLGSRRALN